MPKVSVYIPDAGNGKFQWIRAARVAEAQNLSMSAFILRALQFYCNALAHANKPPTAQIDLPLTYDMPRHHRN